MSSSSSSFSIASTDAVNSDASSSNHTHGSSYHHDDVFAPGNRIGKVLMLQGELLKHVNRNASQMGSATTSTELEVVRRLGAGSYVVVYLVREVFTRVSQQHGLEKTTRKQRMLGIVDELEFWGEEQFDEVDELEYDNDSDDRDGGGFGDLKGRIKSGAVEDEGRSWYGKEFAVKVLSKVGMDEEALEAQLVEVSKVFSTLMQGIQVVLNWMCFRRPKSTSRSRLTQTLSPSTARSRRRALCSSYIPGQDLYYFLEQARDHYEPDPPSGRQSLDHDGDCEKEANMSVLSMCTVGTTRTPPMPGLLSTLNEKPLLGKRRLKLIASMFAQVSE